MARREDSGSSARSCGFSAVAPGFPLRPAGFSTTRYGTSLARSMSNPAGVASVAGLPASRLLKSTPLRVPGVGQCIEKRRDATLGYRGCIPDLRSESVFGGSQTHANAIAHLIRPQLLDGERQNALRGSGTEWTVAPDYPAGKRTQAACAAWTALHHASSPAIDLRDHGPGISGFSGHATLRVVHPSNDLTKTLPQDTHHRLNHTMRSDRDCQPFEAHRAAMPGYAGHIRSRSVA
eukprot:CAMPEP_0117595802 /NCGR_PEP_ID=MMETSP0784-20121206/73958_1 /TAXON_ID=39447 /ORGANISM="" /LENGTH=234 /DNA_ID=CAMNT_0005398011 /DNA_START=48 /DNA_END=752 /DNA_ORIENTATION=-